MKSSAAYQRDRRAKMTPRQRAAAAGQHKYTGIPCPQGHRFRYVANNECVECMKLRRDARRLKQKLKLVGPVIGTMHIAETPDAMTTHTPETLLLAFWKADAAIWRRRMHMMGED